MLLHKKIWFSIGLALVILSAILYLSSRQILMGRFYKLERQNVQINLDRILSALEEDLSSLDNSTCDWAYFDDTYQFVQDRNPKYIKANLTNHIFVELRINLILYLNHNGELVYGKCFDLQKMRETPLPPILEKIYDYLKTGLSNPNYDRSGIILLPESPMHIAIQPILTSDHKGSGQGYLVMGRYLDQKEIEHLIGITHLRFSIIPYQEYQKNDSLKNRRLVNNAEQISVQPLDQKYIMGQVLIKDIFGRPALVINLKLPRSIYNEGQKSIFHILVSLSITSLIFAILLIWYLKKTILTRLFFLNETVSTITASGNYQTRLPVMGNDELTNFTLAINRMMERVQQSHQELESSKNKLRQEHQKLLDLLEFFPDATLVIDSEKKVIAWNRAIEEMTGVKKEEMIGRGDYAYAIPFYGEIRPILLNMVGSDAELVTKNKYENFARKGSTLYADTYVSSLFNGKGAFLSITASPLYDNNGTMVGAIESIRDISKRKKAEEQLKYLSLHDPLTGLYNRAYFEEEIHRLELSRNSQVGILVCDVDGLKLVNDTFGHNAGDKLLVSAASALKSSFRAGDVIARMGGDEFAILLPDADEQFLERAKQRIKTAIDRYRESQPEINLSISVGWATAQLSTKNITETFQEADNNMYREKLHRNFDTKHAVVETLTRALGARDYITEGHADRLKEIAMVMAEKLGLPEKTVNHIGLFAQFHDIGKIGIPDRILFKKGPLTNEELVEMRQHSKIGYEIAESAQDLLNISDWILKHHEWWNGNGYPLGLKGADIPIQCRILAIVDAYDAMTNDRPYRKAMTRHDAVAELRRCAGVQFDPDLVEKFVALIETAN